jgi:hypothetical protein
MRKPWIPDVSGTHGLLPYHAHLQCGFCGEPTVQMIAAVGLCVGHLKVVREIEAGIQTCAPKLARHRKPEKPVITAQCRCGEVFSYVGTQGGTVRWCPDCRKRHGTYARMQHVKRLERERRRSA